MTAPSTLYTLLTRGGELLDESLIPVEQNLRNEIDEQKRLMALPTEDYEILLKIIGQTEDGMKAKLDMLEHNLEALKEWRLRTHSLFLQCDENFRLVEGFQEELNESNFAMSRRIMDEFQIQREAHEKTKKAYKRVKKELAEKTKCLNIAEARLFPPWLSEQSSPTQSRSILHDLNPLGTPSNLEQQNMQSQSRRLREETPEFPYPTYPSP